MTARLRLDIALSAVVLASCGTAPGDAASARDGGCSYGDVPMSSDGRVIGGPFASRVVSFVPGEGATFGHNSMPDVVLGPPRGQGDLLGGLDVVSLGRSGMIVLGFDRAIVDGPGPDFTVFENPFSVPGAELRYWEELAEVSVSNDGTTWATFSCSPLAPRPHTGCAGWEPVYSAPGNGVCALDPYVSGGEGFDLATVGLRRARFVRIRDLATQPVSPPSSGFDLDAVAVLHGE